MNELPFYNILQVFMFSLILGLPYYVKLNNTSKCPVQNKVAGIHIIGPNKILISCSKHMDD